MNKKRIAILISAMILLAVTGAVTYEVHNNKVIEDNKALSESDKTEDFNKDNEEIKLEYSEQPKDDSGKDDLAKQEEQKKDEEDAKNKEEEKKIQEQQLTQQTTNQTNNTSTVPNNNNSEGQAQQHAPQPNKEPQPQSQIPSYTAGVDSGLTSQLRQSLSTGQGYRGSKGSEFQSVCTGIAKGTTSASSLNGKTWQEDLSIIALGLSGMGRITVSSATSNQFSVGKGADVGTIINRGLPNADYTDMVAYRNADGSYTITTLAVKMSIKEGV